MQVIKIIVWVAIAVVFLIFAIANWNPVALQIGPQLFVSTKLPAPILLAFLLGLLPTWIAAKLRIWRLHRRITSLDNSVRATTVTPAVPLATSTQLEAEAAAAPYQPKL